MLSSSPFFSQLARVSKPILLSDFQSFHLFLSRRHQSSDQFHRYLHNPHIVQPDGLDNMYRVRGEQQHWFNVEQWEGYSETYLTRFMQYPATVEHPNPQLNPMHKLLYECLNLCYTLYGSLAQDLQQLHDNPLHPEFHRIIERIKKDREAIASELDKVYPHLHPTIKTIYDSYLVRRYYFLEDWIIHVERKRDDVLNRLSPEFIEQARRAKGVSDYYIRRLKELEVAFTQEPILGLLSNDEIEQYTHEELVMLRQKAAYFRNMKRLGSNQQNSDIHTH